ncbi:hypothetical protein [Rubrivivax gelatinosus]|uniref:hypothetical protein n=1 Tax=Rubrivivax gelatinosus TaxID=28068 RepID=UPI0012FE745C|nr:hypothetical protein [Rubrivivax gelatinosus]MBG6080595.1 hypothetical protein [Rubrivivax gelatinosus]
MQAEATEKALRKLLRDQGLQLKTLNAADVLRLAVANWVANSVDGTRGDSGDGLVAYFELLDRKGAVYEFGVNRIIRPELAEDALYQAWLPMTALRFAIAFRPVLETFQLRAPAAVYACWDKEQSASFIDEVSQSPQFQHCTHQPQKSCSIQLYEGHAPWGEPEHATQGYSWAIG